MELNSIQEIIKDISEGKMVILMDDEDREMKEILFLQQKKSMQILLTSWQHMLEGLYV